MAKQKDKQKRRKTDTDKWRKVVTPNNVILSLLITVLITFFGYLITENKDLKKEFANMKDCVREQMANTKELLAVHLAWHDGKKDK
jgi:D-alanyl-lipoteichoic acid acyltransferase DltB (MBOAT superfamily)